MKLTSYSASGNEYTRCKVLPPDVKNRQEGKGDTNKQFAVQGQLTCKWVDCICGVHEALGLRIIMI